MRLAVGCWVAALGAGCATLCPVITPAEKQTFLSAKPEEGSYVINSGDQIQVEVYQNQQLTRQVTVRPDGMITLPLVNDVAAAGLTVPAFQQRLGERLKAYLKEPIVSVTVSQFSAKQIYIQGQVRQPAAYTYRGEMYILQALALAGGTTAFAQGCAVVVRQKAETFVRYSVELDPLLTGSSMKENILLQPNDVVTIH
ncbi:MAG: polysaccharide biosynthesis/export family protein [Deltaproteobacteria bacterium]|nr:polysaccharide biosynthesis/export family protein [Deltaproteobacteria bacterium]